MLEKYLIAFFVVCLCFYGNDVVNAKLSCIKENGEPTDWYVLYKLPELEHIQDAPAHVRVGLGYASLDDLNTFFMLSSVPINSSESAAGRTLNQVYKAFNGTDKPADQTHLFYNDQNTKNHEFYENGHTKGVVAFDGETGFWLVHSVPSFPPLIADGYGYPHSGQRYGQMFLCITLNTSVINDIGLQLRYNNPHIHDSYMPDHMKDAFPDIDQILQGNIIRTSTNHTLQFESLNGIYKFTSFAKTDKFGKDLYSELVAPAMQVDLVTETWQNGKGDLGPSCDGKYTVEDVMSVNISFPLSRTHCSFHNSEDNSKFAIAVTISRASKFVCIGDVNRQEEQFHRGGGTISTFSELLWSTFIQLTNSVHGCNNKFAEIEI